MENKGGGVYTDTYSINLRIKNAENPAVTYVNEAELSAGNLIISIKVPTVCAIELSIPGLTPPGSNTSYSSKSPESADTHVFSIPNLNGYKIKTSARDHSLNVQCVYTVKGSAVASDVEIEFSLNKLDVDYLSGYFGQVKKDLTKTKLEFDFFEKLDLNGIFGIKEGIKIEAKVTNRTGIPARVETASIKFENAVNNLLKQPFNIDVPAASENDTHVVPVTETATLTNVDFDFDQDDYPYYVNFEIVGVTNPKGTASNFIAKNTNDRTDVDLTFTVPLVVKLKNYERDDNVEFDYRDMLDEKEELHNSVKEMVLNFVVDNNLPFNVILSVHATDEKGKQVGDYLLKNEVINVNDKNKTIKVDKITREQLDKFWDNDVKNIVVTSQAETACADYCPVTKENYLDITVSMYLKASVPLFTLFEK